MKEVILRFWGFCLNFFVRVKALKVKKPKVHTKRGLLSPTESTAPVLPEALKSSLYFQK